MKTRISIFAVLLLVSVACDLPLAQEQAPSDTADSRLSVIGSDTSYVAAGMARRSPTGALLRSAVVPGWGQFYNHDYLKSIVIAAGESYLLYRVVHYWGKTDDAYTRFASTEDLALRDRYFYEYEFYQDRRDLFIWLSGVTIFLSMIEAYVDAHLAGFDVDVTPSFDESDGTGAELRLTYRF